MSATEWLPQTHRQPKRLRRRYTVEELTDQTSPRRRSTRRVADPNGPVRRARRKCSCSTTPPTSIESLQLLARRWSGWWRGGRWWTPAPGLTMFRRTLNGGALAKMSDSNTGHAATRHAGSSSPAPALPQPPGTDPDWREKIETAKRVREETRQARRGKPATFDMEGPPIRVGS